MKEIYVSDAVQQENKVVSACFLVTSKQLKPKKNGELYLDLMLADCTGQIAAKMWDNVAPAAARFELDDVVRVRGVFNRYNGRFQFTIRALEAKLAEQEIDFGDFLPKTARDIGELWRELGGFVDSIGEPQLRALLRAFMADAAIARGLKQAPAAKSLHHACIGGLLDHVVSLLRTCDLVVRNYPLVSRDLLLAGAFLHDIGKVHELSYSRSFSYTTEGQLLGHMIIELEMLHAKMAQLGSFPDELKVVLEHLIISHHGAYEFGSPKLPMFPEALMLHCLDDLDSKMESMRAQLEKDAELESPWTNYNPSLARPLLNTRKYLRNSTPSNTAFAGDHGEAKKQAAAAGEEKQGAE
jgi:3'-5' exoribonuclease